MDELTHLQIVSTLVLIVRHVPDNVRSEWNNLLFSVLIWVKWTKQAAASRPFTHRHTQWGASRTLRPSFVSNTHHKWVAPHSRLLHLHFSEMMTGNFILKTRRLRYRKSLNLLLVNICLVSVPLTWICVYLDGLKSINSCSNGNQNVLWDNHIFTWNLNHLFTLYRELFLISSLVDMSNLMQQSSAAAQTTASTMITLSTQHLSETVWTRTEYDHLQGGFTAGQF